MNFKGSKQSAAFCNYLQLMNISQEASKSNNNNDNNNNKRPENISKL